MDASVSAMIVRAFVLAPEVAERLHEWLMQNRRGKFTLHLDDGRIMGCHEEIVTRVVSKR